MTARSHLFLAARAVHLDRATGGLATSELAASVTERALIRVRKDDGLDIGAVVGYRDAHRAVRGRGKSDG